MYAYLVGVIGLGAIFGLLCFVRKDLRRVMAYSGVFYFLYGFIIFLAIKLLVHEPTRAINPGYWTPPTLFNLNAKTGGYGIEDAFFSLFAGGIAACLYDTFFSFKVAKKSEQKAAAGARLAIRVSYKFSDLYVVAG